MKSLDRLPKEVHPSGTENLLQTLTIAAVLGLLAGLAEGLCNLTLGHYRAPAILSTTLLADLPFFLFQGFALWLLFRVLRRNLDLALGVFLLLWSFLYYVGRTYVPDQRAQTVVLVSSGIIAMLATLFELDHRGWTARVMRRGLPWIAGLALVCLVAVPICDTWAEKRALDGLPSVSPNAPNVVLLIIDTLRADHLHVYSYDRPTSPEIDRLARQGVLFDNAIAAASWTLPSHASMMTGTYPHIHHTDTFRAQLASNLTTLASALEADGYRTAAFSANTFFFNRQRGFGRGFTHFGDFFQSSGEALVRARYVATLDGYLIHHHFLQNFLGRQTAADINRAALHWVDSGHRPFFLALNYLDVHDPYVPPQPWRHMFSKRMNPGGRIDTGEHMLPQLTPAEIQDEMNAYDGGVAYADHELGRLVAALSKRGLLSNTLLVVTADHGEAFGNHGLVGHANALYFPLIHVPLLFRWPGHIPAGVRVSRPVSTKDIGATILALAHSRPNNFPGESLAGLWNGKSDPDSWPLPISELAKLNLSPTFPDHYGPLSTVVAPDMQLIVDPRRGLLLYDWKTDPLETHNLYSDPRYRAEVAALAADMKENGARPLPPANALLPPVQAKYGEVAKAGDSSPARHSKRR